MAPLPAAVRKWAAILSGLLAAGASWTRRSAAALLRRILRSDTRTDRVEGPRSPAENQAATEVSVLGSLKHQAAPVNQD